MFDKLEILRMAHGLAGHAATRQSTIAQNIANADTPGYRARDLASFSETYQISDARAMRSTRTGHVMAGDRTSQTAHASVVYRPGAASPNGNSVSLEGEMMQAAGVKRDHDLALAIYRTSLGILRTSLGRGR